jgi:hypothetical protein
MDLTLLHIQVSRWGCRKKKKNVTMAGLPAGDSIILEEEVDPAYEPTHDEVLEYAKWLGMDCDVDSDLLYVGSHHSVAWLLSTPSVNTEHCANALCHLCMRGIEGELGLMHQLDAHKHADGIRLAWERVLLMC